MDSEQYGIDAGMHNEWLWIHTSKNILYYCVLVDGSNVHLGERSRIIIGKMYRAYKATKELCHRESYKNAI